MNQPARMYLLPLGALLALGLAGCAQLNPLWTLFSPAEQKDEAHGEGGMSQSTASEGTEGTEGMDGGEESATQYGLSDAFDDVRAGARLTLGYDPSSQSFIGRVTNVTDTALSRVRVEVHLSNGVELGPTAPVDLAPGQSVDVSLDASGQRFTTWGAHAEVGGGSGGSEVHAGESEAAGEHGSGGEGSEGSEGGEGSGEHAGGSEGTGG